MTFADYCPKCSTSATRVVLRNGIKCSNCDSYWLGPLDAVQYNAEVQRREKMADTKKDDVPALIKVGRVIRETMVDSATRAGGAVLADSIIALAKRHAGDKWPSWLDSELGLGFARVVVPATAYTISELFQSAIPQAKAVSSVALRALQGTTQESFKAILSKFVPFFTDMAGLELDTTPPKP